MFPVDFLTIIKYAWIDYDPSRRIKSIVDISALVSTNHVYKITLENRQIVIAKLSYFGKYEHFVEDHGIINVLANNLPYPYEGVLSRSLMKGDKVFVHRFQNELIDAWVVFYRPVKIKKRLPRRLNEAEIQLLATEMAHFHKACASIRHTLPPASKDLKHDANHLLEILDTELGRYEHRGHEDVIRHQCATLLENIEALEYRKLEKIPVFVDWNIGNFSVNSRMKLYSRWDYDWFRISSRVLDFYFFSRVVSDIGDRTVFSYLVDPVGQERFLLFLEHYHRVYPLLPAEIRMLKEAYRFFILNYVIKDGTYFFHELYATKLRKEAYELYFPSLEDFSVDHILQKLDLA